MIDRSTYIEMAIRCLLLEAEVLALREHVGKRQAVAAQYERVRDLREGQRLTYPEIGERLGLSPAGARLRYLRTR